MIKIFTTVVHTYLDVTSWLTEKVNSVINFQSLSWHNSFLRLSKNHFFWNNLRNFIKHKKNFSLYPNFQWLIFLAVQLWTPIFHLETLYDFWTLNSVWHCIVSVEIQIPIWKFNEKVSFFDHKLIKLAKMDHFWRFQRTLHYFIPL